jgi:hypothetical protein
MRLRRLAYGCTQQQVGITNHHDKHVRRTYLVCNVLLLTPTQYIPVHTAGLGKVLDNVWIRAKVASLHEIAQQTVVKVANPNGIDVSFGIGLFQGVPCVHPSALFVHHLFTVHPINVLVAADDQQETNEYNIILVGSKQ